LYERQSEKLISVRAFLARLASHSFLALAIAAGSLFMGIDGYHTLLQLPWIDSFLNAAMILGGMGPIDAPRTAAGKLFAGTYALYAGVVFLIGAGIVFAPVVHRIMHRFHLEDD
jgi:hypothetical protein